MKEIVKYTTSYTVYFNKELELEPIQLWEQAFKQIEKALKTEQFVNIWGMIHNKFNILYIKPVKMDEDIFSLLRWLSERHRKEVQKEIKLYKWEVTKRKVEMMIDKHK